MQRSLPPPIIIPPSTLTQEEAREEKGYSIFTDSYHVNAQPIKDSLIVLISDRNPLFTEEYIRKIAWWAQDSDFYKVQFVPTGNLQRFSIELDLRLKHKKSYSIEFDVDKQNAIKQKAKKTGQRTEIQTTNKILSALMVNSPALDYTIIRSKCNEKSRTPVELSSPISPYLDQLKSHVQDNQQWPTNVNHYHTIPNSLFNSPEKTVRTLAGKIKEKTNYIIQKNTKKIDIKDINKSFYESEKIALIFPWESVIGLQKYQRSKLRIEEIAENNFHLDILQRLIKSLRNKYDTQMTQATTALTTNKSCHKSLVKLQAHLDKISTLTENIIEHIKNNLATEISQLPNISNYISQQAEDLLSSLNKKKDKKLASNFFSFLKGKKPHSYLKHSLQPLVMYTAEQRLQYFFVNQKQEASITQSETNFIKENLPLAKELIQEFFVEEIAFLQMLIDKAIQLHRATGECTYLAYPMPESSYPDIFKFAVQLNEFLLNNHPHAFTFVNTSPLASISMNQP